jgi:hypothetical protein
VANEESLWRREMRSVLGKPVDLKWKTYKGKGDKWEALVVRPCRADCKSEAEWAEVLATQKKLEKKGFRFVEDKVTGVALVVKGNPPKAFTSDYDKMGIYQKLGKGPAYHHDPRYNGKGDACPKWQADLNKSVSPEKAMDMHGCQDKYVVETTINGQKVEIMGLQPKVDEKFLIIDENGQGWIVPDLRSLKNYYIDVLKVHWPYSVP